MNPLLPNSNPLLFTLLPALVGAGGALVVFILKELAERNRKRTENLKEKLEAFLERLAEIQSNLAKEDVVPANVWTSQSNKLAGKLYSIEGLVLLYFPSLEKEYRTLEHQIHRHRYSMSKVGEELAPYFEISDQVWKIYQEQARLHLQGSVGEIGDTIRRIRKLVREEKHSLTLEEGMYY